jgi:Aerotolerance regulator N-terminal/von Willebrand factor type A domain
MSFLAPFMLWGTLAAGVPIALHFFFRTRYRRVPWAAMKFLLTSIEQTSRRLRFQELLLLLARVALLVLLALALARPSSVTSGGQGDAVDAVFVIDTSFSMDARDGAGTRLDRAKAAASAVLDHLPPHSTVQVISATDRASLLGPRMPADLEQARKLIADLNVHHLATDFLPAVNDAAAVFARSRAGNKELYLFSDMQKLGWEQQAESLTNKLQAIQRQAAVYLVRCGSRTPRNAAVVGIVPQSGIPHAGERASFAVLVRNSGLEPVRDLSVSLMVDGQAEEKETQALPQLGPGETRAIPLTAKLGQAGLRVLTATVWPDELEADNRFDQVIHVRDQVRVLVVDGSGNEAEPEKAASFYLMHALSPVKDSDRLQYYLQPRLVTPRQALPALLADKDLCILVNVALQPDRQGQRESLPREFVDQLAAFVREGHGLMIFAGDQVAPEPYNGILFEQHHLLPAKLAGKVLNYPDEPLHLNRDSANASSFAILGTDEFYKAINGVSIRRTLDVAEPPRASAGDAAKEAKDAARVILRYSDGRPAVVTKKVDAGEVMLVATSADLSWNDWPLWKGMYVPFVDMSLNHLLRGQTQNHNITAGQPLHWLVADQEATQPFALVDPDGRRVRLGRPVLAEGRGILTADELFRAGVYRLLPDADNNQVVNKALQSSSKKKSAAPAADEGVPFAVVPDLRETENLEAWTDQQLDERLGFKPIHLTAGDDLAVFSGAERQNREWTPWLMVVVLAVAFVETGLAWLCGRPW